MQFLTYQIPLWTFLIAVAVFIFSMVREYKHNESLNRTLTTTGYVLGKYIEKYGDSLANMAIDVLAKEDEHE